MDDNAELGLDDKLDDADDESDGTAQRILEKFAAVFPDADRHDAGYLDNEKRHDGKDKRYRKISVRTAEQRMSVERYASNAGQELEPIQKENENKNGHKKREKAACHLAAPERLDDVIVHEFEHPLQERLRAVRDELKAIAREKRDRDKNRHNDPGRNERIGDGNTEEFTESLCRKGHVDS